MTASTKKWASDSAAPTVSSLYQASKQAATRSYEHSKQRSKEAVATGMDYAKRVVLPHTVQYSGPDAEPTGSQDDDGANVADAVDDDDSSPPEDEVTYDSAEWIDKTRKAPPRPPDTEDAPVL
eukprot:CAMPEP_0118923362 /NCGR_PEP_ID=MMETSP1169-20130426/1919_1 /TAXON_ID=36882 /ORGANISM="Pyramimonas obovata, Strain CCMP722" /LENGTH=122 /DNA_ID=CAMNT_0006864335 /DNA_START=161 /DNA_END=526 /DNA_ORIENTATION=+